MSATPPAPAFTTSLTERLAIRHPILLAPMGAIAGGRLAAAVTRAGGLGFIGPGYHDSAWIDRELDAAGEERVGIGFITWHLARDPARLTRALARRPAAVMLSFGDAAPFVDQVRRAGALLFVQIQTLHAARAALALGADVLVAQGTEAGGTALPGLSSPSCRRCNRARTLIYSTGLPPAVAGAAIAAIDLIEREPARLAEPLQKARAFTRAAGLPEAQSAIVPVLIGAADAALAASQLLEAEGYLAVAIRPPTVPEGTARLRLSFSAAHPDAEIARLAELVRTRILRNA